MTTFTTEDREMAGRGAAEDAYMTYSDIAKELGVTRNRVQQIESSALEKLRKKLIWGYDVFSSKDIV